MLVSAAVLAGVTAGLFDYHGAIARARYLDAAYARMMIVKNLLGLVLMVGGAWWLRDATMVLLGGLASTAASLLAVRRALADAPLALGGFRKDLAWSFACYALPLVAGNAIYSLIPLINRSFLAGTHGFAEAGYFSLASDIGLRLFGTLGATIEIVLLRQILRLEEEKGRAAARRRIAANLPLVLAIALPIAVGLLCVLPAFDRLVVPPSFRGSFTAYMTLLLPGFVAITLFQAALYPVFLVEKRTLVATFAALLALAVNLGLGYGLAGPVGPHGYAMAQSTAFLSVLAVTGFAALRSLPVPPLRDCGLVIFAVVVMGAAVWPLRDRFAALPELALQAGLGVAVYGGVLLAADALRGRTLLRLWWLARRSRRRAS
jgi:O-antigen/teichoic acid export membrane protein